MSCCGKIVKAVKYTAAQIGWRRAGKPTRTDDEMKSILDNQCKPCEYYQEGTCGLCGCALNLEPYQRNKLWLTTQHCPVDKW